MWRLEGGYEYVDEEADCPLVLSVTLRYRGIEDPSAPLPPAEAARARAADEAHDEVAIAHIKWVRRFGFRNSSAEAAAAADELDAMYCRLLARAPVRDESLYNRALFYQDVRGDWEAAAAAWRAWDPESNMTAADARGEAELVEVQTPEEEAAQEALHDYIEAEVPEHLRARAHLAPHLIRWPWSNVTRDIPKGRYIREARARPRPRPRPRPRARPRRGP